MKLKNIMAALIVTATLLLTQSTFASAKAEVTGVVNINTATHEQLMLLPGIGDVKADAILAQRQVKPFASADDLLAVKGIGEKMLEKMNAFVVTQGATTIRSESVAVANQPVKTVAK